MHNNKAKRNNILTSNVSSVRQAAVEASAACQRNVNAMKTFGSLPVLSQCSVSLAKDESNCPTVLGKGRFSSVYRGTFHKLSMPVAVKQVKSTQREVIAKSKVYQALSGHHAFLYCFGLLELRFNQYSREANIVDEMAIEEDLRIQGDQCTMEIIKQIGNSIHPSIQPARKGIKQREKRLLIGTGKEVMSRWFLYSLQQDQS